MNVVTITRNDAVTLCVALGFKTAGKWNKQRMLDKLSDLSKMANDDGIEVDSDEVKDAERLNKILSKIAKADEVVVVTKPVEEEPKEEQPVEEKKEVKADKKPAKKSKKVEAEQEDEPVADKSRDKFGYKNGTKVSVFLSCLSKKPKTVEQLCAEAETKQQRGAFPELIKKGLVIKEGNTYRLA